MMRGEKGCEIVHTDIGHLDRPARSLQPKEDLTALVVRARLWFDWSEG